jgi:hypothetical protein
MFDRPVQLTRTQLREFRDIAIASASIEALCQAQEGLNDYDHKHSDGSAQRTELESEIDRMVRQIESVSAEFEVEVENLIARKSGAFQSGRPGQCGEKSLAELVTSRDEKHQSLLHRLQELIHSSDEIVIP